MPLRVDLVAGARPNIPKVAALWHALRGAVWCRPRLVHTGQHSSPAMREAIWDDLDLPPPEVALGVTGGSPGELIGRTVSAYAAVLAESRPDLVVVVGDVNATLAAAIAAQAAAIPLAHLEAGLRSGDRSMPEERNRIAVDAMADHLWTPSEDADANLAAEARAGRVLRVGNAMIDSLERTRPRWQARTLPEGVGPGGYGVVTLHRPATVDDGATLERHLAALGRVSARLKLVFPVHPRTRARLAGLALPAGLHPVEPFGYLDFLALLSRARVAITDSGGVQEEAVHLGVPCVTLRPTTERPVTLRGGMNRLASVDRLEQAVWPDAPPTFEPIALWDGRAGERVAEALRALS